MATKFIVIPRRWRGIRNNDSAVLLEPDEWADGKNIDARFGRSNLGSTVVVTADPLPAPATQVLGLTNYYDTTDTLRRVWVDSDGDVYEDDAIADVFRAGSFTLSSTTDPIPYFASGTGSIVVCRGTDGKPVWKDPSDATWKDMTGAPDTDVVTAAFEVGGPRLFVAPGTLGVDSWAWSEAGDLDDFAATGSGEEAIGDDRRKITAISDGLENNMLIGKEHSLYIRAGTDPDTWRIIRISNDIGITAPLSLVRISKSLFFIHESGMYFVNAKGAVAFPPLSHRIQDTWDSMISNFGAYLRYAHAAYHSTEQTIYAWIPNQSSRVMNRLIKIYVPNGALTIHDGKDSGGSHSFPATGGSQIEFGKDSEILKVGGLTDDGTDISIERTSGIFAGNPPTLDMEKRWGRRGIIHFFFDCKTDDETVTITPRVYRQNEAVASGTAQNCSLTAGQVTKCAVKFPRSSGWGIDFQLTGAFNQGQVKFIGMTGEYTDVTDD